MQFASMENLSRWIAAYEKMDARRRKESLVIAEATAIAHPTEPAKKVTRLELVSNNSGIDDTRHGLRRSDDGGAALIIRSAE